MCPYGMGQDDRDYIEYERCYMEKIKKILSKYKFHILIFAVCLFISARFMKSSIMFTHDGYVHFLRVMCTCQEYEAGNYNPIILSRMCSGFGYAANLFYNPLCTYIPCLFSFFTNSYVDGIKIFMCLNIFLAAEFMFIFLKNVSKKDSLATLGAIIYVLSPYYLSDFFIRGAVGEIIGLTFLPLLFLGLYSLINGDERKHYFIIIATVGIALSHNITLFYSAIFSIIFMVLNIRKILSKPKMIIKYCIIDLIFISLLTAFYMVPLMITKHDTEYVIFNSQHMFTNNEFASNNSIDYNELFFNKEKRMVICKIGVPTLIGLCLLLIFHNKINKKDKYFLLILLLFGSFSIFMATKYFPWKSVPEIFCILQFPWRMIGFATFFLSVCASFGINNLLDILFKDRKQFMYMYIIIIVVLIISYTFIFTGIKIKDKSNDSIYEKTMKSLDYDININDINKDYLPEKAFNNYYYEYVYTRDKQSAKLLQGKGTILNQRKGHLKFDLNINVESDDVVIEFPYLYYLGYEATGTKKNGDKIKIDTVESKNGFVAVSVSNRDIEEISLEFKTPNSYKVAYGISFLGLVLVIVIFVIKKCKKIDKSVETKKNE